MQFTLRIRSFPITPVIRILKQGLPSSPLLAYGNLPQMICNQLFNALANCITTNLTAVSNPPPN